MTYLPEKIHREIIMRMANLEKVDKKIIEEVETVLREQLESFGGAEGKQIGGVELGGEHPQPDGQKARG